MKITMILGLAFFIFAHVANADSSHHNGSQTTNIYNNGSGKTGVSGVSAAFSCGSIEFETSNYKQLGAALGGYDGTLAPCVGGAITTDKNRSLYTGRVGTEDGKWGGAISGTWKFK